MYPLTSSFKKPILEFIHSLAMHPGVNVKRNNLSTQLFGDFDVLMPLLNTKMKSAMETDKAVVMVLKIVNADLKD